VVCDFGETVENALDFLEIPYDSVHLPVDSFVVHEQPVHLVVDFKQDFAESWIAQERSDSVLVVSLDGKLVIEARLTHSHVLKTECCAQPAEQMLAVKSDSQVKRRFDEKLDDCEPLARVTGTPHFRVDLDMVAFVGSRDITQKRNDTLPRMVGQSALRRDVIPDFDPFALEPIQLRGKG
jgi:hypothetical protein